MVSLLRMCKATIMPYRLHMPIRLMLIAVHPIMAQTTPPVQWGGTAYEIDANLVLLTAAMRFRHVFRRLI